MPRGTAMVMQGDEAYYVNIACYLSNGHLLDDFRQGWQNIYWFVTGWHVWQGFRLLDWDNFELLEGT